MCPGIRTFEFDTLNQIHQVILVFNSILNISVVSFKLTSTSTKVSIKTMWLSGWPFFLNGGILEMKWQMFIYLKRKIGKNFLFSGRNSKKTFQLNFINVKESSLLFSRLSVIALALIKTIKTVISYSFVLLNILQDLKHWNFIGPLFKTDILIDIFFILNR